MSKIFLVLLLTFCLAIAVEADVFRQADNYIKSIELNDDMREDLRRSVRQNLPASVSKKSLDRKQLQGFEGIINTGLFEEVEVDKIGRVAAMGCSAMLNGAPPETIVDMSLIAFSKPLTESQMTTGAKAMKKMSDAGIPDDIEQQVLSYAFYNDWSNGNIEGIANGIIRGQRQNIPLEKLALALILRVDQGTVGSSFDNAVSEEIEYIRNLRTSDPERQRRDSIYSSMQSAVENGVPSGVAGDFYYNAVDENWSADDSKRLFEALAEGVRKGMTPERLALAFIIRMESDRGKISIERIISDEMNYVASLEKDRIALRKEKYEPPKPPIQRPGKPFTYGLNIPLMQNTIEGFLGTPYVWGGRTRRGTDCSGFTQSVYIEQGIMLPRVSREQYNVGFHVDSQNLTFGDLVFFNKSGYGKITHVGIYVGNGRFAHASCSKGVTVSNLNKSFYRKRLAGVKRVAAR